SLFFFIFLMNDHLMNIYRFVNDKLIGGTCVYGFFKQCSSRQGITESGKLRNYLIFKSEVIFYMKNQTWNPCIYFTNCIFITIMETNITINCFRIIYKCIEIKKSVNNNI
uniref:Uncharacterized protein n=1 Tax=Strongyloides stercoralis TaxID=6248 RepID=A0AAF5DJQ1_STRER